MHFWACALSLSRCGLLEDTEHQGEGQDPDGVSGLRPNCPQTPSTAKPVTVSDSAPWAAGSRPHVRITCRDWSWHWKLPPKSLVNGLRWAWASLFEKLPWWLWWAVGTENLAEVPGAAEPPDPFPVPGASPNLFQRVTSWRCCQHLLLLSF